MLPKDLPFAHSFASISLLMADSSPVSSSVARSKGEEGSDDLLSLAEEVDYDDEVPVSGDIDIGEIVTQYLSLEL